MAYDADTYRKAITTLSNDELIRRLHLDMFNDDARPIALQEAERRSLVFEPTDTPAVIENAQRDERAARTRRYVWLVTTPVAAAGAAALGIAGGIGGLLIGRVIAGQIDSRIQSPFARAVLGFALVAVVLVIAGALASQRRH